MHTYLGFRFACDMEPLECRRRGVTAGDVLSGSTRAVVGAVACMATRVGPSVLPKVRGDWEKKCQHPSHGTGHLQSGLALSLACCAALGRSLSPLGVAHIVQDRQPFLIVESLLVLRPTDVI